MSVSISKFRTSHEAEEALRSLRSKTGLSFNLLCRLAWSRSLQSAESVDTTHPEITGKEFNRYSVTGEYDDLMKALTAQHAGMKLSDEDFVGKYLKTHVDRGLILLQRDAAGTESLDAFWSKLLASIPRQSSGPVQATYSDVQPINVQVGEEIGSGEPVVCSLNVATNPHIAVIGIPGSGKTQFIKKLLADIRSAHPKVNFVFLDYAKGDVAGDSLFVEATKAHVYKLPDRAFPINPFMLQSYDQTSIRFSAEEKVESINSYEHLGAVQKGLLARAIEGAYQERSLEDAPYPDFEVVQRHLRLVYEEEDRKEDTLTEILRKLTSFRLFPTLQDPLLLLDSLLDQSLIVDLHRPARPA